jgi:replicative DNA helicase
MPRSFEYPVELRSLADALDGVAAQVDLRRRGILSGLPDLDVLTGGLRKGEVMVVAGKTSLAVCFVHHWIQRSKFPPLFVTLEVGPSAIATRYLAAATGVSLDKIRNLFLDDEEVRALADGKDSLRKARLWLLDAPGYTLESIEQGIRRFRDVECSRDGASHLVVIDGLQLIRLLPDRDEEAQAGPLLQQLRATARELQLIVLATIETRSEPHVPARLDDLRTMGISEDDADVLALLSRPPWQDQTDLTLMGLNVVRNAVGPVGEVLLRLHTGTLRIESARTTGGSAT